MKTIKQLLFVLLIGISLSSCKTYYLGQKTMMNIQKGMTKEEITQMLGAPDYRRFGKEVDQWIYRRADRVLALNFTNNQVESMNTLPDMSYLYIDNAPITEQYGLSGTDDKIVQNQ
ncbi:MAG: hypothetical protein QM751_14585 [Paludibacteraceae bacterium]